MREAQLCKIPECRLASGGGASTVPYNNFTQKYTAKNANSVQGTFYKNICNSTFVIEN